MYHHQNVECQFAHREHSSPRQTHQAWHNVSLLSLWLWINKLVRRVYKEGTLLRQIGGLEARHLTLAPHSGISGIIISREALLDSSNWRNSKNCALQHCSSGYGSVVNPLAVWRLLSLRFSHSGKEKGWGFWFVASDPLVQRYLQRCFSQPAHWKHQCPWQAFYQSTFPVCQVRVLNV